MTFISFGDSVMATILHTSSESLGQRLLRLRTERGLSQKQLQTTGISDVFISYLEQDKRYPSTETLRRLAKKLEVTPLYLETGQEEYCPHCLTRLKEGK